jgi:hypothetical protein
MSLSSKRGILLLVAGFLLVAAAYAPPAPGHGPQGAQLLATCPALRCPNGTILTCTLTPCSPIDNCSMICDGRAIFCSGRCIQE